jgi:hypothetical protein
MTDVTWRSPLGGNLPFHVTHGFLRYPPDIVATTLAILRVLGPFVGFQRAPWRAGYWVTSCESGTIDHSTFNNRSRRESLQSRQVTIYE